MAIYMKFGSINGAVTTAGFVKWIELDSFQWGVGRAIGSAARGAEREGSEPSLSEITVTKAMDIASPQLFLDAVAGTMQSKVEIDFTRTVQNKVQTYLKYVLTDTGLSGYSVSSGGDTPSESFSLNFTQLQETYTNFNPDGTAGTPETVGYDLPQMKTV
jgi:type VI secretion system secreted protein Hcp